MLPFVAALTSPAPTQFQIAHGDFNGNGVLDIGDADGMVAAMAECGCKLNNAFMQHSLLALVVIPELRISDLGLVDAVRFERVGVLV